MSFEDFQDGWHGCHLGYRNRTILAILNSIPIQVPQYVIQRETAMSVQNCWYLRKQNVQYKFREGYIVRAPR